MIRELPTGRGSGVSPQKLALLRQMLAGEAAGTPAIPRRAGGDAPLSFAQQRIWFLDQLENKPLYHIPVTLALRGPLEIATLERALNHVIARHDSLRTTFPTGGNGQPSSVIHSTRSITLPVVDIPASSGEDQLALVRRLAGEQLRRPFDLAAGSLIRGSIFRLNNEDHVLALVLHHIVSDWWSMEVLVRELVTLYSAFTAGTPSPLPELPVQYPDFAAWQHEQLQGPALSEQLAYWTQQLGGSPPLLDLPTDHPRPRRPTYRGGRAFFELDASLRDGLHALSRQQGVTLFMTLLAAFQLLLARYARQSDIVVATPVAGRHRREVEGLIGLFLNTLVLRTDLSGDPSFCELLHRVRQVALDGYAHQEVPFERIVDALQPERDLNRTPLFQVMFALQDAVRASAMTFNGLDLELIPLEAETAKFDLSLVAFDRGTTLTGALEYSADLFEPQTMARMMGRWQRLLEAVVAQASRPISQLPWLDDAERRQLLQGWNATSVPLPESCLHQLVEAQATRSPDAVAVQFGAQPLSYAELEARANQLAHRLRRAGVGPEAIVGVCMERSLELVIALLGTLKAGAAYLPLDPDYPAERLAFMLADAGAAVVLTQTHLVERVPPGDRPVWCLDVDGETIAPESADRVVTNLQPDNRAYVIYTSGSTGRPKGVISTHRGIVNRLQWMQAEYAVQVGEGVLQKTPFSFDVSVWEFFWPLLAGGRLVLAAPGGHRDADDLVRVLAEREVSTVHFVPSMLALFLEAEGLERLSALRRILCSGEALPRELAQRCRERLPHVSLHNLYGPTEASVDVSATAFDATAAGATVPIGRPVFNTQLYVLDASGQPLPIGVPGELYLGGVQLARGYLHRPDLTAERFVPDHLHQDGGRLYRTGDLARWLPDGRVEYRGRLDHQVKLRGFRIELGEIEAVLAQHPATREAAVLVREDTPGERRLVAYLVFMHPDEGPTTDALRAYLQQRVPEYMVPAVFMPLAAMPLSPNGKLDRKALPVPDPVRPQLAEGFIAPATEAEKGLAEIWKEVLHLDQVGVHDNFFALGGDSMRAVQVISLARQRGIPLTLAALFERQTVATLADAIATSAPEVDAPPTRAFELLTPSDRERLPGGLEDAYPLTRLQAGMLHHLSSDLKAPAYHNVTALPIRARFEPALMQTVVDGVVARHPVLRTSFDLAAFSEPLQLVHDTAQLAITTSDLRQLDPAAQERAVDEWMAAEQDRLFDLSRPPLMRIHLLQTADDGFWFAAAEAHPILDGWSFTSTIAEILGRYADLLAGEALHRDPPPAASFRDFVNVERRALESAESRSFWAESLQGASALRLPRRPSAGEPGGTVHRRVVPFADDVIEGLERLAQRANVPLKSVLLAAHIKAMSLLSGQRDVLTGMVSHGRPEVMDGDQVRGLFLNTVPLRVRLDRQTWQELVRTVFDVERRILPHRRYPFGALQTAWGTEPMLETLFNYTNFHALEGALKRPQTLEFVSLWKERAHTNQPLLASFDKLPGIGGTRLVLILTCDARQLAAPQVEEIGEVFTAVLSAMAAKPQQRHHDSALLPRTDAERVTRWNATATALPAGCLHQLVEAQVKRTPDAVAVQHGNDQLRYAELEARANQLAHQLQREGVGPETVVGVCMERSLDLVVALLGTLKAGAAYLPLDPEFPPERLAFMLADASPRVLLTESRLKDRLPPGDIPRLCVDSDWSQIATQPIDPVTTNLQPDHPAYVIYTSGSTGRPKGVISTHRGIVNRLQWMQAEYGLEAGEGVLQKTPFSFDVSVWEFFWPLLVGGRLVLAAPGGHRDAGYLVQLLRESAVSTVHFVPSMLALFLDADGIERLSSLRRVLCSGEALPRELAQRCRQRLPQAMIANLYGPTEASVDVSALTFDGSGAGPTVPIGRPVFNTQLEVLDSWGQRVPIGVPGELCLGGVQLARGYLNRPDLTAERFTPDPFGSDGGRLYRSGDLTRWLPDGTVEYLGRLDHQVKLRGYRIELGEIEAVLAQHPQLREVAVLAREDRAGDRRLVAYLVPTDPAAAPTPEVLRTFLRARLPRYMLPTAFVVLNAMPLTSNGKLDRKALPSPIAKPRAAGSGAAPSTPSEEILAHAWAEVLRVDRVGVHENFFELGGDSILGIQIVARVNQAGLRLTPKDLFEHQTIAELARVAVMARPITVEPGPIVGEVPLSPIQHWFFELGLPEPDHWNQALLLEAPNALDPVIMERALAHLCRHHDALRHAFHREAGAWQQTAAPPDDRAMVTTIDLSRLSGDEQRHAIESAAAAFQGTLNLASGPLLRALHMNLGPGRSGRLLLVLHHLVVDGVSWRIILEDLQRAYQQLRTSTTVALPARTSSFRQWATRLYEYAESDAVRGQRAYWSSPRRLEAAAIPIDQMRGPNIEASSAEVSVGLDREQTNALLREVPTAYHTQAADALITALLTALARWTGCSSLLIDLEGHGRETIFDDIDLSRTVGWFTAIFPAFLELPGGGPGEAIKSIKEQLRRIPDRGLGYGLLRYLSADPAIRATLRSLPPAEVVFNYAGQLEQTSGGAGFTRAPEQAGPNHAPGGGRTHPLEVSVVITDGQLQASFGYSRNLHDRQTIERLAQDFIAALTELIAHCTSPDAGGYTPSDFPQAGLQQAELDRLLERLEDAQGAA